ncbi:MAG TPA: hypothetical protein VFE54_05555 [Mucilaginibacter sp.]|jgi:hypothetical protein|nr:hypothetical protein [Mucilaginibacter sp.]
MMKRVLIIVCVACAISACKKTGVSPGLFGKWELREASGGDFAYQDSVYKPGNGNIYQFNADSTYSAYLNHNLSAHGVFHIRKAIIPSGNSVDILLFDSNTDGWPITISGTTMTLVTEAGWFQDRYQKISN